MKMSLVKIGSIFNLIILTLALLFGIAFFVMYHEDEKYDALNEQIEQEKEELRQEREKLGIPAPIEIKIETYDGDTETEKKVIKEKSDRQLESFEFLVNKSPIAYAVLLVISILILVFAKQTKIDLILSIIGLIISLVWIIITPPHSYTNFICCLFWPLLGGIVFPIIGFILCVIGNVNRMKNEKATV